MLYDPSKDYNETGRHLLKAAQILEERGHAKKVLQDWRGRVCLVGALNAAIYNNAVFDVGAWTEPMYKAIYALDRNIHLPGYYTPGKLVMWNNSPERTGQEVIDLFRKAAETCKHGS